MKEINLKFESCLENQTLQREIVTFKAESGKILGTVHLRQLTREEALNLQEDIESPDASLKCTFKCIESWDFKDGDDKPVELSFENFKKLSSKKKIEGKYAGGIIDHLIEIVTEMNFVGETEEKNSAGQ